jgi:hypothetical protein
LEIGESTTRSYTDTGLTPETIYYYKVTAIDTAGTESNRSTSGSAGTNSNVPTGVTASALSSTSIAISWNSVSDAVKYKIYRSGSSTGAYLEIGESTTLLYTDTGLSTGTTYYYKVSAISSVWVGTQSAAVSATTQIGTSITITLAAQNDVGISTQSASIPRGQSRIFQVMGSYTSYQWYLNGDAITGAAAASYMLNTASMKLGVYELAVMVSTGEGARLSGACRVRVE